MYFNPSLCASYQPVWGDAAAQGLLIRESSGQPHVYPAFVGGAEPAGFTTEPLSQFDFTAPGIDAFYGALLGEAVDGGHDGWMEDFGEGVPPTGVAADGTSGTALHNRYPTDYHCAVQRILATLKPDAVRHLRSGWTGTARCAVNVWGGDPTTTWGFDGLESGVRQALGIGMSGVSRFGTDIGGYNTYGTAGAADARAARSAGSSSGPCPASCARSAPAWRSPPTSGRRSSTRRSFRTGAGTRSCTRSSIRTSSPRTGRTAAPGFR